MFRKHHSHNCYAGYGAVDLEPVAGEAYRAHIALHACKQACRDTPGCTGIVFTASGVQWESAKGSCYRRAKLELVECDPSDAYDTYELMRPAPPPAPPAFPLPPESPVTPAAAVAVRLNERFARGGPSNTLEGAGLLIHQFDAYDDGNDPTQPPWDRCDAWNCKKHSDRVSAMAVSASSRRDPSGALPIFSHGLSGMIFKPSANRVLCAYPYDAGTAERDCPRLGGTANCVPGCTPRGQATRWCNERRGWPCAWPGDHLKDAMEIRERIAANPGTWELDVDRSYIHWDKFYMEIVMEYLAFERNLPDSIEAIFYQPHGCRDTRPQPWMGSATRTKCEQYARWAHERLQERWPKEAPSIPLLVFDVFAQENPLSVDPNSAG